jgi:hypothetical protein
LVDGKDEANKNIELKSKSSKNPVVLLNKYEKEAADLANHFEENMIRF